MVHNNHDLLKLLLCLLIPLFIITLSILFIYLYRRTSSVTDSDSDPDPDPEVGRNTTTVNKNDEGEGEGDEDEGLMCFEGGEDLKVTDILDAAGEVIGKSSYGTLYKANVSSSSTLLLRFLRPVCSGTLQDVITVAHVTGLVRHSNLVPLLAFYVGPSGEKLLLYPFYPLPNLSHFIKDGSIESRKWDTIYNIALGLAKGLAHLHSGLDKPVIHGNLKSKNVLLGPNFKPYISDYSIHLLLNQKAGQEMLESSAFQGYKAPELMKIKDACESTDIYSLGIILLELLTGREAVNLKSSDFREMYLPNAIRRAILDNRIKDVYHGDLVLNLNGEERYQIEERALQLVQLAISCCCPSPSLRPLANDIVRKLEELHKDR